MQSPKVKPELVDLLNDCDTGKRLDALMKITNFWDLNVGNRPAPNPIDVNNHIHSTYSFSPYSPTKAVYMSVEAGLSTAGIMDHDSISGAHEFIAAGSIASLPVTIGWEMRISMENSPFAKKRINNPDQKGNMYVTVHGLPHNQIPKVAYFLKPINIARGERNKKMLININKIVEPLGIYLDYEKDILPYSMSGSGGSVTERHLLFALSNALVDKFGMNEHLIDQLSSVLKLNVSNKIEEMLLEKDNPYYVYDLLGLLKAELVSSFYINAESDECMEVSDFIPFVKSIGAISCGAYLGDVGNSITGDKKAQKFEYDYIDELFAYYAEVGFEGISYMPSRNSESQIEKVRSLCVEHSFIQISGEDINQPRQKFICEKAREIEFANLIKTTWALIGNEYSAKQDLENSITSLRMKHLYPDIESRIEAFAGIGRSNSVCKSTI